MRSAVTIKLRVVGVKARNLEGTGGRLAQPADRASCKLVLFICKVILWDFTLMLGQGARRWEVSNPVVVLDTMRISDDTRTSRLRDCAH